MIEKPRNIPPNPPDWVAKISFISFPASQIAQKERKLNVTFRIFT